MVCVNDSRLHPGGGVQLLDSLCRRVLPKTLILAGQSGVYVLIVHPSIKFFYAWSPHGYTLVTH